MKRFTRSKRALLVVSGVALVSLAAGTARSMSTDSALRRDIRFLPAQEWGFGGLVGDGPDRVVIEQKYGCIEVISIHPR